MLFCMRKRGKECTCLGGREYDGVKMGWILVPELSKKCAEFIEKNPQLKISKFVYRKGSFVFYRKYTTVQNITHESANFRICCVADEKGVEGWCVDYMRYTGKWQNLPLFGDFEYCLKEIKSGKCAVLNPME